jgi:hypothetical protein
MAGKRARNAGAEQMGPRVKRREIETRPLVRRDAPSHAHRVHVKAWCAAPHPLAEHVGEGQRIEEARQPDIEDFIEREYGDAHGEIAIINVEFSSTRGSGGGLPSVHPARRWSQQEESSSW